jgi:hypothetical protein
VPKIASLVVSYFRIGATTTGACGEEERQSSHRVSEIGHIPEGLLPAKPGVKPGVKQRVAFITPTERSFVAR